MVDLYLFLSLSLYFATYIGFQGVILAMLDDDNDNHSEKDRERERVKNENKGRSPVYG